MISGTELILIGWKIVPNEEHVQCDHRFASQPLANEPLHSTQVFRKRAAQLHYVGPELRYIFWPPTSVSFDISESIINRIVYNGLIEGKG